MANKDWMDRKLMGYYLKKEARKTKADIEEWQNGSMAEKDKGEEDCMDRKLRKENYIFELRIPVDTKRIPKNKI